MVAVVFLVLYITKMMPIDGDRPKEDKRVSSHFSGEKKSEKALGQSGVERDRKALEAPTETPRPRDAEQAKAPVPDEGQLGEASVPQGKAEAKKREAPARGTEVLGYRAVASKEAARANVPAAEPGKIEEELAVREKTLVASKSPQQIILRISDRKKAISRLNELVKQFGGDVVTTKEDMFLASLPTSTFSEFEKELAGFSSSAKADRLIEKKDAVGSLRLAEGAKKEEGDEKRKGSAMLAADTGGRTIVRILLVEE